MRLIYLKLATTSHLPHPHLSLHPPRPSQITLCFFFLLLVLLCFTRFGGILCSMFAFYLYHHMHHILSSFVCLHYNHHLLSPRVYRSTFPSNISFPFLTPMFLSSRSSRSLTHSPTLGPFLPCFLACTHPHTFPWFCFTHPSRPDLPFILQTDN